MMTYMFNRFETIDNLIRLKCTGTPENLAKRLGISKRTLFESLGTMKYLGAPISYCKIRQTYYYTEQGQFHLRFKKAERYGS